MKTAMRMVGDTVSSERKENDFYPTPTWVTEALLDREEFAGTTWEPACGDGAISKVLKSRGKHVISTDIVYRGYPMTCGETLDFLECKWGFNTPVRNIITNPPFSLCSEFIDQSKRFASHKIAMFLKTTALEGNRRHKMWIDQSFPFARMYQFVNRVSFGKEEGLNRGGGLMAFAWFVWDRDHAGPPTIHWIQPTPRTENTQTKLF